MPKIRRITCDFCGQPVYGVGQIIRFKGKQLSNVFCFMKCAKLYAQKHGLQMPPEATRATLRTLKGITQ